MKSLNNLRRCCRGRSCCTDRLPLEESFQERSEGNHFPGARNRSGHSCSAENRSPSGDRSKGLPSNRRTARRCRNFLRQEAANYSGKAGNRANSPARRNSFHRDSSRPRNPEGCIPMPPREEPRKMSEDIPGPETTSAAPDCRHPEHSSRESHRTHSDTEPARTNRESGFPKARRLDNCFDCCIEDDTPGRTARAASAAGILPAAHQAAAATSPRDAVSHRPRARHTAVQRRHPSTSSRKGCRTSTSWGYRTCRSYSGNPPEAIREPLSKINIRFWFASDHILLIYCEKRYLLNASPGRTHDVSKPSPSPLFVFLTHGKRNGSFCDCHLPSTGLMAEDPFFFDQGNGGYLSLSC